MGRKEMLWIHIENGLNSIYNKERFDISRLNELQSYVRDFIYYNGNKEYNVEELPLDKVADNCNKLHHFFNQYILHRVKSCKIQIEESNGAEFVGEYVRLWKSFNCGSKIIDGIFDKFNELWKRFNTDKYNVGSQSVVYNLSIHCWKVELFDNILTNLSHEILNLIKAERKNKPINASLISKAISSYLEIDKHSSSNSYKRFEAEFIHKTKKYHKHLAEDLIKKYSNKEYLNKLVEIYNAESLRVERYMHPSTMKPLIEALDKILINDHLDIFRIAMKEMSLNPDLEELNTIKKLFDRVDEVKKDLDQYGGQEGLKK